MNLSRRDFLKALGITAGVTAVGLPLLTDSVTAIDLPVAEVSDRQSASDINSAWIEIDKKRYAASSIQFVYGFYELSEVVANLDECITGSYRREFYLAVSMPGFDNLITGIGSFRNIKSSTSSYSQESLVHIDLSFPVLVSREQYARAVEDWTPSRVTTFTVTNVTVGDAL